MVHKVRIERAFHLSPDAYSVWFFKYDLRSEDSFCAKPVAFEYEKSPEGWALPQPTLNAEPEQLIALGQQLLEKGFMAKLATTDSETKEALKNHVQSLEKIIERWPL